MSELTDELRSAGFFDDDLYSGEDGEDALVLWLTN